MAKKYAKAFYQSAAWKRCRRSYLQSKHYVCERCGGLASVVHHKHYISPKNIDNPNVTLNWDNLEALCATCHELEHHANHHATRKGLRFNEHGELIKDGTIDTPAVEKANA